MSDKILPSNLTFEAREPGIYFKCSCAVFPVGADGSLCYTTSEERAEMIADALNERAVLLKPAPAGSGGDKELVDALVKYGKHTRDCNLESAFSRTKGCNCELGKIIKRHNQ